VGKGLKMAHTLLVVDSMENVERYSQLVFEKFMPSQIGCIVVAKEEQAISTIDDAVKAGNGKVDLVMFGFHMPPAMCIEIATQINEKYPHMPIIVPTAENPVWKARTIQEADYQAYYSRKLGDKMDIVRNALETM